MSSPYSPFIFQGSYAKSIAEGGLPLNVTTKTGNYTATIADDLILCNTNALTITLPAASGNAGKVIHIKTIDSGAHTMTISRAGSDTIEGATSVALTTQYTGYTLVSDGTATWVILSTGLWA